MFKQCGRLLATILMLMYPLTSAVGQQIPPGTASNADNSRGQLAQTVQMTNDVSRAEALSAAHRRWGVFVDYTTTWNRIGFSPVTSTYFTAHALTGGKIGGDVPVRFTWYKKKDELFLQEIWMYPDMNYEIPFDWQRNPKDGTLKRLEYWYEHPFVIAADGTVTGKGRIREDAAQMEYRLTRDGLLLTRYNEKPDGSRELVERYIFLPSSAEEYAAAVSAAATRKIASKGGGFVGALATVAQGVAVAAGEYANVRGGGSPSGDYGTAGNPIDPNSEQNRQFRENLNAIGQRAQAGAQARTAAQNRGNGSSAAATRNNAPQSASQPASAATAREAFVRGPTTITFMLQIGTHETMGTDSNGSNGECFSSVRTIPAPTKPADGRAPPAKNQQAGPSQ